MIRNTSLVILESNAGFKCSYCEMVMAENVETAVYRGEMNFEWVGFRDGEKGVSIEYLCQAHLIAFCENYRDSEKER
jgi:hypothetical protein